LQASAESFPEDVLELQRLFGEVEPGQHIRAVPGAGLRVPIWLLGSSGFSAQLAAKLGLPFAFAAHFAPDFLYAAAQMYLSQFRPSPTLSRPYLMVAVQVIAAETDAEARRLFTTPQQRFLRLIRNQPVELLPPVDSMEPLWNHDGERQAVEQRLSAAIVGSDETVKAGLQKLIDRTGASEVIVVTDTYEHEARLASYARVAAVAAAIPRKTPAAATF
jgi:luciferase family oxidoreductase group 1